MTRKGATSARKGELGIIPGSMGTGSYIVMGKGNEESFHSCSHGAGRKMSRTKAYSGVSQAEFERSMEVCTFIVQTQIRLLFYFPYFSYLLLTMSRRGSCVMWMLG